VLVVFGLCYGLLFWYILMFDFVVMYMLVVMVVFSFCFIELVILESVDFL